MHIRILTVFALELFRERTAFKTQVAPLIVASPQILPRELAYANRFEK